MAIKQMKKSAGATTTVAPTGRWRVARGQSIVEFALIMPIFLALIFGIIEIGRAWAAKQSLTLATREGARVLAAAHGPGLLYASESDKQTAAVEAVKSYMRNSGLAVTADTKIVAVRFLPGNDHVVGTSDDPVQQNYSNAVRGDRVGISIKYPFETPLPILLSMFNDGVDDPPLASAINMGVVSHLTQE